MKPPKRQAPPPSAESTHLNGTLFRVPREVALGRSIPDTTGLPVSPRALEERGFGTRRRYLIVCLWRRLLASHHILTLRGPRLKRVQDRGWEKGTRPPACAVHRAGEGH